MRGILLVSVAAILATLKPAIAQREHPVPLAEAVSKFNDQARHYATGKNQPPLTEEAVVAAIRWAMLDRNKLQVSDNTFQQLGEIADRRLLPKDFELEIATGYEPNDRVTFDVWSVRLRIPGGPHPGGSTCITVMEHMIKSRLIGDEERKTIQAWRKKEQDRGGVGSFERVDWMRAYRKAREDAAELDRSKR